MKTTAPPTPGSHSSDSCLVDQELLVLLRPEETGKGVFLHQGVDPLLGQVKGRGGEIHQVPQGHVLGEVVDVHLSGSLRLDEVFIDLFGFGGHLHGVLGLLEVLAGHPELNILIAELGLQEASESMETVAVVQDPVQTLTPLSGLIRSGLLQLLRLLLGLLRVGDDEVDGILGLLK